MSIEDAVPTAEPVPVDAPRSVGFWVRGGALFVDMILASIPLGALVGVLVRHLGGALYATVAASFLVGAVYQTFTVGRWGQSVGKMAAGIQITRTDGASVGYGRAFARFLAHYLSAIPLDLGVMMAAFTPQKRALHDYIVDTRVVYLPGIGRARQAAMAALGVLVPVFSIALGVYWGMNSVFARHASIHEARGDYALAAEDYGRLIRLSPWRPELWNLRCWDRALAGQLDGALADCDESLRLSRIAPTLDSKGLVLLKMKRFDEAIASYDEALALNPNLAYSLYGRGLARAEIGDPTGSQADMEAALRLEPEIGAQYQKFGLALSSGSAGIPASKILR